jgi:lipopolysaccharide export LptBFGC system permease protein LptF
MRIAPGKLAVVFLVLTFAVFITTKAASGITQNAAWNYAVETVGKIGTLFFAASFACAIVAVASRPSRIAGVIVLLIDAAIVGFIILVVRAWRLP